LKGRNGSGWRVWQGSHPLERFIEIPEEVPVFWEEISEDLVKRLNQRFKWMTLANHPPHE
jgi:hypothetical protein